MVREEQTGSVTSRQLGQFGIGANIEYKQRPGKGLLCSWLLDTYLTRHDAASVAKPPVSAGAGLVTRQILTGGISMPGAGIRRR